MVEYLKEHEPLEPGKRLIDWGSVDNANAFERSIYGITVEEGFMEMASDVIELTSKLGGDRHD